ncbi:hypothetical protein, partial [Crocosphaera sp. Alani8]|uniref:hypothetical protein n=1 Tax=Crocosphaera sp. Alani8 TaxID=3038952 RepID=UPI00313ADBA4
SISKGFYKGVKKSGFGIMCFRHSHNRESLYFRREDGTESAGAIVALGQPCLASVRFHQKGYQRSYTLW